MPGKFLIDLTDSRFLIDANEDVVWVIRVANPFGPSNVGSRWCRRAFDLASNDEPSA
jgi:hypothetical protein